MGDLDRPDLIELPYEDPDLILGASALLPAAAQIRVFQQSDAAKGGRVQLRATVLSEA